MPVRLRFAPDNQKAVKSMPHADPIEARQKIVKVAREVAVPWKGRLFGYNPVANRRKGQPYVRPVQPLTRELLEVLYAKFVEMDLEAYNKTRKAAGLKRLSRSKAVVEEAAYHVPHFTDDTNAHGYPREFSQGMYEFLIEFFSESISMASS